MTYDQLCEIRTSAAMAAYDHDALDKGPTDGYSMVNSVKAETLTNDDIGYLIGTLDLTLGRDLGEDELRALNHALRELLWHRRADDQAAATATDEEMLKLSSATPALA